MIKREVIEDGLVADLFYDVDQPRKVIIMLGGSEGGETWSRIRQPVGLLVQRGYTIFSLAYFKAQGLPGTLEEIPLEYFEKAFAWLSAQSGIVADKYAILGGSKGAEAALLLGSRYPQIKAIVAFSPSSVVWQGIPKGRFDLGKAVKSSWSYQGKSLPFLAYPTPISKMTLITLRLRKLHEVALQDKARVEEAAIPVENIQGSILLISGKRDLLWPATYMSEQIEKRLTAKGFEHHCEHMAVDVGHNGLIINRACWRKVFDFLQKNYT
jgi:pimeloyl-ACP methyl ester carboxylesterase